MPFVKRKLLSGAFVALILEKGYEAVTIGNIIDRANVGHSTFYAHFESKQQLLFSGQEHLQQMLFSKEDTAGKVIDFIFLYEHAADNFQIAKAMLGKKRGDLIIQHIQGVMTFIKLSRTEKR